MVLDNSALHAQIAHNIKAFRAQRELTLNGLASLTGIGKSTLSNLERGQGNPTIETIWRLAEVLDVGYGDLVEQAPPQPSKSAGVSVELLHREAGERQVETFLMKLDPAAQRQATAHGAGVSEHVLVVRGMLSLQRSQQTQVLHAGDATTFAADFEHGYQAGEDGAHAIVSIVYPGRHDAPAQAPLPGQLWPQSRQAWLALAEHVRQLRVEAKHGMPCARVRFEDCPLALGAARAQLVQQLGDALRDEPGMSVRIAGVNTPEIVVLASSGAHERLSVDVDAQPLAAAVRKANCVIGRAPAAGEAEHEQRADFASTLTARALAAATLATESRHAESPARDAGNANECTHGDMAVEEPLAGSLLRPGYVRQCVEAAAHLHGLDLSAQTPVLAACAGSGQTLALVDELSHDIRFQAQEAHASAHAQLQARFECNARVVTTLSTLEAMPRAAGYAHIIAVDPSHSPDAASFLDAAHACLRPGGTLFVSADMIASFASKGEWLTNVMAHHLRHIHDTLVAVEPDTATHTEAQLVDCMVRTVPGLLHDTLAGHAETVAARVRQLLQVVQQLALPAQASTQALAFYRFHIIELQALVTALDQDMARRTSPDCFVDLASEIGFDPLAHRRIYATHERSRWGAGTHIFTFKAL